MSYPFKIAWRYFFSKSNQTVINRINAFAFFMVIVASSTLFIVLSAFSGLKDFSLSFSNTFDPDFEIKPERGSYFIVSNEALNQIEKIPQIYAAAPLVEEKVFLSFKEKSQVAFLKAAPAEYLKVVSIDSLIALGDWISYNGPDVVVGFGIAGNMGLGIYDYNTYLNVIVPKKNKKTLLNKNPFNSAPTIVSGLYQISEDLDKKYIFSSISFGQNLLGLDSNQFSSVVLKTFPGVEKHTLEKKLSGLFKNPIRIISREEQNTALYRMLNLEHLAIYFIFSLVMIIALFNVIGSLIMMILDKKQQLKILLTMGAKTSEIHKIFFLLGMLICSVGGLIGLFLGSLLVIVQFHFPFIFVPGTNLAYPVLFKVKNIVTVFGTLMILGTICTAWATRGLNKKTQL